MMHKYTLELNFKNGEKKTESFVAKTPIEAHQAAYKKYREELAATVLIAD